MWNVKILPQAQEPSGAIAVLHEKFIAILSY